MGVHPFQTNFAAGELSPGLFARTDYKKYPNGMELGMNAVVKVTGGVSRAAGSEFIAKGKDRSAFQASMVQDSAFQVFPQKGARLIPFIFNTQEAYVLEVGHKYMRFYRNRAQLLGTGTGSELMTNGGFPFDLSSWTLQQDNGGTVVWAAPGVAQLDPGSAGAAGISQLISGLVAGDTYVLNFEVGGGSAILNVGSTLGQGNLVTERTLTPGSYRVTFVASAPGNAVVYLRATAPNVVVRIDNVSLKAAAPLEITTPYKAADVRSIRFTQSADTLYLTHRSYPTKKLIRLSDSLWTLQDAVFTPPPTAEIAITPSAKLTPGAVIGQGVTFTADASVFLQADVNRQIKAQGGVAIIKTYVSGTQVTADIVAPFLSTDPIAGGLWSMDGSPSSDVTLSANKPINAVVTVTLTTAGFRSTDVGRFVIGLDGVLEITNVTSSTVASAQILKAPTGITLVAGAWTLESEAFTEDQGYAEVCNFFEQRFWLFKGFTAFGSVSGDFENHALGPKDDDAVKFPIVNGSNQVDVIRWVKSMKDMLTGTIGTEYRLYGGTEQPITPTHILTKPQGAWGSDPEPDACRAGDAVLFVQRGRRQIRELGFQLEKDGWDAADISVLAEHLFRTGVVELAYCSSPDSYILAVTEDGRLMVCTYYRNEDVVAWTQLRPAGWEIGKGKYRSVCVIPAKCGSGDEIWVLVERVINGRTGLYVEVFDGQLNTQCARVYDDKIPADTIVGLAHLEGATVDVVYTRQSAFQKSAFQMTAFQRVRSRDITATVSGGSVTIPTPAVRIEVGLHYDTDILTLDLETQTQAGTAHFRKKRSPALYVRFYCSKGDGITVNGEAVDRLKLEADEIYDYTKEANLGWDRKDKVRIRQTKPYSMTVLGVSRDFIIDDGNAP